MKLPARVLSVGLLALALTAGYIGMSHRETPPPVNSVEVGKVAWGRDFDRASALAKTSGKPVLVLFQEVPGCKGCEKFGREVMSDPGIVKAIEGHLGKPALVPKQPQYVRALGAAVFARQMEREGAASC